MRYRALTTGLLAGLVLGLCVFLAADGAAAAERPPHSELIPPDKGLTEGQIENMYDRGGPLIYSGDDLKTIGMPVGGVGAGQLYLRGDGTLAHWRIFNKHINTGYGAESYRTFRPASDVEQGFAVIARQNGRTKARTLSRGDFPQVRFRGEYPIATVTYPAGDFPLQVTMEAFTPFIPLNAKDSGLPATVFRITVQNTSSGPVEAGVAGWLQNAVCFRSAELVNARRRIRRGQVGDDGTAIYHTIHAAEGERPEPRRVLIQDFEGDDYGDWEAEGEAFTGGPAHGTMPHQQKVSGFRGRGLVNSFRGDKAESTEEGDGFQGTLTSPLFTISRDYINFLVGGGSYEGRTCVQLVVDGDVVRSATGRNTEELTWQSWGVQDLEGKKARIRLVDRHSGGWGHILFDHVEQANVPRTGPRKPLDELRGYGSMALALDGPAAKDGQTRAMADAVESGDLQLSPGGDVSYPAAEERSGALAARPVTLGEGEKRAFTFVLGWFFPNHSDGRYYATRFSSAREVAGYVVDEMDRLAGNTRLWRRTFYRDSTLPWWLLFRLHAPVANLATNTCIWRRSGRFWCWEGVGCCHGTCTHVWNYAQAHARLFPRLARSIREMQDFRDVEDGGGFNPESGLVGFRSNRAYAADGQCSTVLKAYREHLMSADDSFLEDNWPRIKKALQYLIDQDGDGNGLIERSQHNTFDIEFYGPNTFVGSLYLAALRAGEEMARDAGDGEFAHRCRELFESGRRLSVERLWNGEYFIQDVDLEQHPQHQYARGCLSDQMFGQAWAHRLGLGYIYPQGKVRKALESVWTYNWAPDIGPYNEVYAPERVFARAGEPGLFTCTWPHTEHMEQGVRYRDEVWTGIEYQVASGMAWEDMVTRALAVVRGVHERYHPARHNPYNEVECGEHYARALASWGVYSALAGYRYDGPDGHLAFAPRMKKDDFRAAFTAAEGWGLLEQERSEGDQRNRIEVRWGRIRLRSLSLALPDGMDAPEVTVRAADQPVDAEASVSGGKLHVEFPREFTLQADQALEVEVE